MTRGDQDVMDNVTAVETVKSSVHNVTESNRTSTDFTQSLVQFVSSNVSYNGIINQGNATSFPINISMPTVSATNATTHQAKSTQRTKFENEASSTTTFSYWDNYDAYNNLPNMNRLMRSRKSKCHETRFFKNKNILICGIEWHVVTDHFSSLMLYPLVYPLQRSSDWKTFVHPGI